MRPRLLERYETEIRKAYPKLEIIRGTHKPLNVGEFRRGIHELICPSLKPPQDANDLTLGSIELPDGPLRF